jgi:multidrug efflux pump
MDASEQTNRQLFEDMPVPKALATMAIPTIISQLITLAYNLADAFFVGRTGNPFMIAAVSLIFPVFSITIALSNLYGIGGGSLMARLLGKGEEESARKISAFSICASLVTSLLFSLCLYAWRDPVLRLLGTSPDTYAYTENYLFWVVIVGAIPAVFSGTMAHLLRSVGFAKKASLGLSLGAILNILLDPLFMFVLLPHGMEVTGAALATLLSNCVSMLYFVEALYRLAPKSALSYRFTQGLPSREDIVSVFYVGLPSAMSNFLVDAANLSLNHLMAGFGDTQLAALGIVLKAERVPINTGLGICQGMLPLVAYQYGSQKWTRMHSFIRTARRVGLLFAICCVILYELAAPFIIRLFIAARPDDTLAMATLAMGIFFLRFRCLASPFAILNMHITFSLQALGDGRATFLVASLRQAIIYIPLMHILASYFGSQGLIVSQTVAEIITFILAFPLFRKRLAPLKDPLSE